MNHVLLLHDLDGPHGSAAHFAAKLQQQGFSVAVPELFPSPPPEAADETALFDWATSLADSAVLETARAAFENIASESAARIAVCGLGWGGAYALLLGAHEPRVAATIDIGGTITYAAWTAKRPGSPLNFVAGLNAPFFAAFSNADTHNSPDEIGRLRSRLVEHDKIGEVKIYDAPSHFWREDGEATRALWIRLSAYLADIFEPQTVEASPQQIRPGDGYPNEASRLHA